MIKKANIDDETGEIRWVQPHMRTMYNFDRDESSKRTATTCEVESRTQQQFADETNINKIMERYGITGTVPTNVRPVLPDEYEEVFDFQTAVNTVRKAQESFMQMPAGVRQRFSNNPQIFTEFFMQEENRAEAEKWGLVLPRPTKETSIEPPKATD